MTQVAGHIEVDPAPLTLRQSRVGPTLVIVLALGFMALGFTTADSTGEGVSPSVKWQTPDLTWVALCGLGIVWGALKLAFPNRLTIAEDGVTVATLITRRHISWQDAENFQRNPYVRFRPLISYDDPAGTWRSNMFLQLVGFRSLPGDWASEVDLVWLLNKARAHWTSLGRSPIWTQSGSRTASSKSRAPS